MLVRLADAMNIQKPGRYQRACPFLGGGRAITEEFHFKSTFLSCLAQGGRFRIFVEFNVPADGKPFGELPVMHQQDSLLLNDEDGDSEINFFVYMGHGPGRGLWARRSRASNLLFHLDRCDGPSYSLSNHIHLCTMCLSMATVGEQ